MKVVHIADGALAAAPYRLMQVQRLGGLEARLINCLYTGDWYPRDLVMEDGPEALAGVVAQADVIHYHNRWRQSRLFACHPWMWPLVEGKPSVIQFHSARRAEFEEALAAPSLVKLVVAQYQPRLYPECRPVLNAVPIDDPLHSPHASAAPDDGRRRERPPVVAFTPPQCSDLEGWSRKGCAETLRVLRQGFAHRFVTGVPWEAAMRLRRECDIAIDEVVTGSYHMCSLEALSQGLATIAGLDVKTVDALERATGTRRHPWVVAKPETLHGELARLCADRDYLRSRQLAARAYMEEFWNPAVFVATFTEVYELALAAA
jgi:hypothetical protein